MYKEALFSSPSRPQQDHFKLSYWGLKVIHRNKTRISPLEAAGNKPNFLRFSLKVREGDHAET